jgi:hypothetical protein
MEITVRTEGGVFGDDRMRRIRDRMLTVTNHGALEVQRELSARTVAELADLARVVAGLRPAPPAEPGYVDDGGTTTIEITLPDASARIVLNAGENAAQPVWDLLDAVERAERG